MRSMSSGRAPQVAVVGGGIAGAVCSSVLSRHGADVTVFDMGRNLPGGRATSRLTPDGHQFDAGAQSFRATSPAMRARVHEWLQEGVVAEWRPVAGLYDTSTGSFRRREELGGEEARALGGSFFDVLTATADSPLYVGLPSMGALVAHLLQPSEGREAQGAGGGHTQLCVNTKVQTARFADGRWWLEGAPAAQAGQSNAGAGGPSPLGCFDALVLADSQPAREGAPGHISFQGGSGGPPPAPLTSLLSRVSALPRLPLMSLLLAWDTATHGPLLPGGAEAALLAAGSGGGGGAFQWLAADSSKPGRPHKDGLTRWVAITRPEFAAALIGAGSGSGSAAGSAPGALPQQDPAYRASLAEQLWAALQRDLGAGKPGLPPLPAPVHLSAQRWGGALPSSPLGLPAVWDDPGRWAACGDFCAGPRLEAAADSGAAAAEAVLAMLGLRGSA